MPRHETNERCSYHDWRAVKFITQSNLLLSQIYCSVKFTTHPGLNAEVESYKRILHEQGVQQQEVSESARKQALEITQLYQV